MAAMTQDELDTFLTRYPEMEMLEVLMPDMNGIFRGKRIHRSEFQGLLDGALKAVSTQPLVTTMGDYDDEVDPALVAGEPDKKLLPVAATLAPVPWLGSPTGQVVAGLYEADGAPCWVDPRNVLAAVVQRLEQDGLRPVVATEMEFYLLAPGQEGSPRPLLGTNRGTGSEQQGIQYAMLEDLWENDAFLDEVRTTCEVQGIHLTTIHCEFAPGQWEINTHHLDDPLLACDQALMLKRIVKGVAFKHGLGACFMAKPFAHSAGCGMHIHTSLYNAAGDNIFSRPDVQDTPAVSDTLRHAVGGLVRTMPEAMAIFAPNANSYRRFVPGSYVPLAPCWGYNHRDVSLRIPVSEHQNRRVEHRVSGADANPYLVVAAILAGMHYGISRQCEPGPMVPENSEIPDFDAVLPRRWEQALEAFSGATVLPEYLGESYCSAFAAMRRAECEAFHAQISDIDYAWYLRAV